MNEKLIPEINIGLLGHVDHGKSTLVQALTGKWPDTHSEEMKRGITIRIGYADFTIYKCKCGYSLKENCEKCNEKGEAIRTISLVDAPGHETLMATAISASAIMDGVLFIIAADEKCPQPQTKEHLSVLNVMGIENIVVVQNKIDMVSKERALESYKEIKEFLKGTIAENSPIIPVSALHSTNIEFLLEAIEKYIPTPKRNEREDPEMLIVRSFDVNKPGIKVNDMHGGVVGGSLVRGILKKNDEIEIKPGFKDKKGNWNSIITEIGNIKHGRYDVNVAKPGGLMAIETLLDPYMTKSDSLSGQILGIKEKLPETCHNLNFEFHTLNLDVPSEIKTNDILLLSVGTAKTTGVVKSAGKHINVILKIPVCCRKNQKIAVSKLINNRWRLIGYGEII